MKTHWSQLTKEQQECYCIDKGCGPGKAWFLIPQFIFKTSCYQHDFYYARGGWFIDFVEANVMFYAHMLSDITDFPHKWYKKFLYFIMATLYFLAVSVYGLVFFKWGRYKTPKEVLKDCFYAE